MSTGDIIKFGSYRLIPEERLLLRDGETVDLGSRVLDVLIALVESAGEVVGQRELIARAWPNVVVGDGSLRVTIASLRKALGDGEDGARYITNVTGRGYCFVAPVERSAPHTLSLASKPAVSEALSVAKRTLPPPLARMVGRQAAVAALSALLATQRFVSVVGPGGMGKTTVAVSVAHALLNQFSDAVYFVDLGAVTEASVVASAVATAVGSSVQAHDPLPSLMAFLADRRILLILDNCEHVIDAAAVLAERLYSEALHVHILTTTREALRVEGEHVYILSPLDYPLERSNLTAKDAIASPAVQLFMERAFASGHLSELTDAEAPIVAAICSQLDGIALAIELAGSRVGTYGLQGTADLLSNRFRLLWQGRRSAPPRHQTLHAMLDWSFNLLAERDRCVLTRLSVFVGVFTLDAAQAIVSDPDINSRDFAESIASLVGKSLISVSQSDGVPVYRLLDSTLVFASEKLGQTFEANAFSRRHALYYSTWCSGIARTNFPTYGQRAPAAIEPHLGNIRAALEWSFSDNGEHGIGVALAAAAVPLFFDISSLAECRRWCKVGLSTSAATDAAGAIRLTLHATLAAASMFALGNGPHVLKLIEDALELAASLGDKLHQIHLLAGLNLFHTRVGDFNEAVAVAQRGRLIAQDIGTPEAKATGEWMLGVSYHLAGDQPAARLHCERGLTEASTLDPAQMVLFGYDQRIRALLALARSLWLTGFPDQATAIAQRAVDEANMHDHPVILCMALIYSITVFLWSGDFKRSEKLINELVIHAGTHSLGPYSNVGLALSGEFSVRRGDATNGVPMLRRALSLLQTEQYHTLSPAIHSAIAAGLSQLGQGTEASTFLDLASERPYSTTKDIYAPELLRLRGELYRNSGGHDLAAEEAFQLAINTARSQSALSFELRAVIGLARLWSSAEKKKEAAALLQDVYGRFTEGFETADLRNARELLATLGQIPPAPHS